MQRKWFVLLCCTLRAQSNEIMTCQSGYDFTQSVLADRSLPSMAFFVIEDDGLSSFVSLHFP